jgi:spermidine synthase
MTLSNDGTVKCIFLQTPTEQQIEQIVEIYREQGWWNPSDEVRPQLIPRLISGSHCFAVAAEGDRIIGMGRAISDGISDAYIQDLAVLRSHRKQGIGKIILQALLERLEADGLSWIGLIAEPGSYNLYCLSGFQEMTAWVPMLLIKKP